MHFNYCILKVVIFASISLLDCVYLCAFVTPILPLLKKRRKKEAENYNAERDFSINILLIPTQIIWYPLLVILENNWQFYL